MAFRILFRFFISITSGGIDQHEFSDAETRKLLDHDAADAPEQQLTQIGRALKELNIELIAAHSPQAKGRIERAFQTAQDRLVKGLRQVESKDLESANAYLEQVFLTLWNRRFRREP